MLVLSRKNRESVVVGGTDGFHHLLKVTVLDIRGANVKLGFEADRSVSVHRGEVWERIRAEDCHAACSSGICGTKEG
jgi:carbon storage regulator